MTVQLDRSRSYGKISGDEFIPDGCDRPAKYEQDAKLFDAHFRLIEPGVTASIVPTEDDGDDQQAAPTSITVADLLRQADNMHWRTFKKAATAVLGSECPSAKGQIIEALQAAQHEFEARAGRRKTVQVGAAKVTTERPSGLSPSGIDLAAWGRGQQEYLWGDVRKAIKSEFGRNVTERDDAVEFLVEQGKITAAEARQDVIREV